MLVKIPVLRWKTNGITVAGLSGQSGNASNRLSGPVDVVLDWTNNLYIADANNNRIQKYLSTFTTGQTIAGTGENGSTPSQLYNPSRLLLDKNENLYISDSYNTRVQFWNKGATNGSTVAGVTGVYGAANNLFNIPYGLAHNPISDTLYVSDYQNHRIMSYPSGVKNGTKIFGGNGAGTSDTQLYTPIGLHYDAFSNSLFIGNFRAHNIIQYVFGATNWTLIAGNRNGTSGATSMSFNYCTDMTLDPMGNVYVSDRENHRIQFFPSGEVNGTTIAGITGIMVRNDTTLYRPWAVRLDSQLNLYVADTYNHRIQKFLRY